MERSREWIDEWTWTYQRKQHLVSNNAVRFLGNTLNK
jgi:hypothetical protein